MYRISTYCTYHDCTTCVEVADDAGGILVRDTRGTVLRFSTQAWRAFVAQHT